MAKDELEKNKRLLTRDISKAYYTVVYLQNKQQRYRLVDSIYTRFSEVAEFSFKQGEIAYLEMLNAKSKHDHVRILQNQLQHDIDIAITSLATLMHYDSLFTIPDEELIELVVKPDGVEDDPGFQYMQHAILQRDAAIKVEKNKLLPDVTVSYFQGTNKYADSKNYQGFQVGVGIPLFFSEQRGKAKAEQYAWEAIKYLQTDYIHVYQNKVSEMMTGLDKYKESIKYYEHSGKQPGGRTDQVRAEKLCCRRD